MALKLTRSEAMVRKWLLPGAAVAICLLLIAILMDGISFEAAYRDAGADLDAREAALAAGPGASEPARTGSSAAAGAAAEGVGPQPAAARRNAGEPEEQLTGASGDPEMEPVAGAEDDPRFADDPQARAQAASQSTASFSAGGSAAELTTNSQSTAEESLGVVELLPEAAPGADAGARPRAVVPSGAADEAASAGDAPGDREQELASADAGAPAPPGDDEAPDDDPPEPEPVPEPEPCGVVFCPIGLECCNASCGICTPPGGSCSPFTCSMPRYPFSVRCGQNTCSVDEVCCNPSCGICAAPGQSCSQRICD